MGLFGKLFSRASPPCAMEAYVARMTPDSMGRLMQTTKEGLKVPTAQAVTVMLFSGMFAKGLRESANSMPDDMRNDWPYPYEKILTEAAGFHYFYMIKDYLPNPDEDGVWPGDDDNESEGAEPYFESLKLSMHVCGALIHALSGERIPERFVANRAMSYASILRQPSKDVVGALQGYIMRAWTPSHDERPVLKLTAPIIPIQAAIASMPVDSVRDACRDLYDEKLKNPRAY